MKGFKEALRPFVSFYRRKSFFRPGATSEIVFSSYGYPVLTHEPLTFLVKCHCSEHDETAQIM